LKFELDTFLKSYEKLIILGIGNELRGDDGLGSFIIKELQNEKDIVKNSAIILIDGGSVIVNTIFKEKNTIWCHGIY